MIISPIDIIEDYSAAFKQSIDQAFFIWQEPSTYGALLK
jgi:hypothetical protein